jgi:hypothetical protein
LNELLFLCRVDVIADDAGQHGGFSLRFGATVGDVRLRMFRLRSKYGRQGAASA